MVLFAIQQDPGYEVEVKSTSGELSRPGIHLWYTELASWAFHLYSFTEHHT